MTKPEPKPWPMKWVALITIVCLAAYTALTLAYRKPTGHAHEPYAEAKARAATVKRFEDAGYKLTIASTERPATPAIVAEAISRFRANIAPAPAGVPTEISVLLSELPRLADSFKQVAAPATALTSEPYQILYTCQLPDDRKILGDTLVYIKGDDMVVITNFAKLDDDLHARTTDTPVLLSIPGNTFAPARTYTITLVAQNESRRWTVLAN